MKNYFAAMLMASSSIIAIAENNGQWHINPTLGYQYSDSERDLDDDGLLGLGLEYRYNETWGTELKYLQGSLDNKYGLANDADTKHLLIEGLYYLKSSSSKKFAPYFAAGLGHSEYDYETSGKDGSTNALVGPGFRYGFSERWSSKVDLRWIHGVDESENDGLLTVALSYALGKASPKTVVAQSISVGDADKDGINDKDDQCPNTAAGVKVNAKGCELDTDGDGVADSKDQCPDTVVGAKVDSKGCAEKLTRTETIALKITFASGSAELASDFMPELDKVSRFMHKYASVKGVIEGHTDSKGSAAFNQNLSQRRAEMVRRVLVDKFAIDAQRLTAIGYGESQPIAPNDTVAGRQNNRRVVAAFEAQVTE